MINMRTPIIAGNWKLNKTPHEAVNLINELKRELANATGVDIVVCPPFTDLADAADILVEQNIALGAQNVFWEESGAFTGEVSASMLKDLGVRYVIVGHSERRQYFGETDTTVAKRIRACLKHGLIPIVCVGEDLAEREGNRTFSVIQTQIEGSLAGLTPDEMKIMAVAYEPVWAIGTGKTATPQQAQDVHAFIRGLLTKIFGADTAQAVRIQYGGSVTPENSAALMANPDIDGALVGGASLKAVSFAAIVTSAMK